MLTSDTSNVLTFNPPAAKDAMLESTGYTVQSNSDVSPITLALTINSVDTPSIFLVNFDVTGIQDVSYYFTVGNNGEPKEPQHPTTSDTSATVINSFSTPVSADTIVITLTPAAPNTDVTLSSLFVDACFTPGKPLHYHYMYLYVSCLFCGTSSGNSSYVVIPIFWKTVL